MRVVDRVLMNNSPSNSFKILLFLERYHQNCQAVLAAIGTKGLTALTWFDTSEPFRPIVSKNIQFW